MMDLGTCMNTTQDNLTVANNTCDVANFTTNVCMIMHANKITEFTDLKNFELVQMLILPSVTIWITYKIVHLIKRFYTENSEPAIIFELVFLANIPALYGFLFLLNVTRLAGYYLLEEFVCSLLFWARVSFYADVCLIFLDKFVALYWSLNYNDLVTKTKAVAASIFARTATLLWTVIFNSVYRYLLYLNA